MEPNIEGAVDALPIEEVKAWAPLKKGVTLSLENDLNPKSESGHRASLVRANRYKNRDSVSLWFMPVPVSTPRNPMSGRCSSL